MLSLQTSAVAEVQIDLNRDVETNLITGTVNIGEGTRYRTITIRTENEHGDIIYLGQIYSDEAGKASFSYIHDSENAGTGLMTVTASHDNERAAAQYSVVDGSKISAIIEAIRSECAKSSPSSEVLKNAYLGKDENMNGKPDNAEILNLNLTLYETLTNKDKVWSILGNDPANRSLRGTDDVLKAFYDAVALEKLSESKSASDVTALMANNLYSSIFKKDRIPVDANGACVLDTFSDTVRDKVYERLLSSNMSTKDDLADKFVLYVLSEAIRFGQWQDVITVLKVYDSAGYITLNFSDYNTLKNKTNVDKSMSGKQYSSFKEIETEFSNAVTKQKKAENSSPSGSSGGGGGGGGSISVVVPPVTSTPMPTNTVSDTNEDVNTGTNGESTANGEITGKLIFSDMTEAKWAIEAVESLYKSGIINGTSETTFEPNRGITRAELAKILIGMAGLDPVSEDIFADVTPDMWYYPYAAAAYKAGIAQGDDTRSFNGQNIVNREEMAAMVYRMIDRKGLIIEQSDTTDFDDAEDISDWAIDSVNYLKSIGVVNGRSKNFFEPRAELTRAEAATVIYKLISKK